MFPADLGARWRAKAIELRAFGAEEQAKTLEWCAGGLEESLKEHDQESLNLQDAAEESGYSSDHLGRFVREGKIHNAGRQGAPRIRRCDLPIKATQEDSAVPQHNRISDTSNAQIVQSIIERGIE